MDATARGSAAGSEREDHPCVVERSALAQEQQLAREARPARRHADRGRPDREQRRVVDRVHLSVGSRHRRRVGLADPRRERDRFAERIRGEAPAIEHAVFRARQHRVRERIDERGVDAPLAHPQAVREWCINTALVDPFTHSVLAGSEDGVLYRWSLATNSFSESITLTPGIGEAYTPTVSGPDGQVYAINNATLFAVGATSVGVPAGGASLTRKLLLLR